MTKYISLILLMPVSLIISHKANKESCKDMGKQ
jgi:hypothetical protein